MNALKEDRIYKKIMRPVFGPLYLAIFCEKRTADKQTDTEFGEVNELCQIAC